MHPWNDTNHRQDCMLLLLAIVELRSDMIVGGSEALSGTNWHTCKDGRFDIVVSSHPQLDSSSGERCTASKKLMDERTTVQGEMCNPTSQTKTVR